MKVIEEDKAPSIHFWVGNWCLSGKPVRKIREFKGPTDGQPSAHLLAEMQDEDADGRETIHPKSRDFPYYENSHGIRQT